MLNTADTLTALTATQDVVFHIKNAHQQARTVITAISWNEMVKLK